MVEQILSIKQVVAEKTDFPIKKISNVMAIASHMMKEIGDSTQENLVLLCMDTKNVITSYSVVHIGSLNQSIAHPRDIFQRAVLSNAARIMLVHNHPSNNCTPSKNDIGFTERIEECGKIMGIELLDHIIVGTSNYYSFREEERLKLVS